MFRLHHMLSVCFLAVTIVSTAAAQEGANSIVQRSSVTITATAIGERVRITAPSSVVQMHVEVYAASGEKVFDQEIRGGNVFDWHLQDGQAQRLAPGTYQCVVTAKSISGKLTQKIGTVNVEEKSVSVQAADSRQLSAAQAQPIGPVEEDPSWTIAAKDEPQTPTVIANDGTDGQMIRGRGALTFRIGNFFSGIDTEQMRLTEAGNLGIGTAEPKAKLEVAGTIRAERFLVAKPNPHGSNEIVGNSAQVTDDAGSVQPLIAGTGTQNQIAKWIDNSATLGNSGITETATGVGIGTPTPTQALDVANGRIVTTGNKTLTVSSDSMLEVKSAITNNGLAQSAIKARNIFNGSGDFVTGLDVAPTFAPSQSINTAQGFVAAASFAPPAGVTITNANGGASATVYSNVPGAVTNGTAFNIVSPFVFGALRPTNQYGLRINNQGIAGTTNSYGLFVDPQSGSTNSFSAIFAGGNVGIGTSAPVSRLEVVNSASQIRFGENANETGGFLVSSAVSEATLSGGAKWNGSAWVAPLISQASMTSMKSGTIKFFTDTGLTPGSTFTPTERMRITATGSVGIGTAGGPQNPLDVEGSGTDTGGAIGASQVVARFKQASSGVHTALSIDASSGLDSILYLAEQGAAKWDVRNDGGTDDFLIRSRNSDGTGNTRLTIEPNGNVGIGTTNPGHRLDVVGSSSSGHVAAIINTFVDVSDDSDGLIIDINTNNVNPQRTNNYISFRRVGDSVGSIQGNTNGGIEIGSPGSDYAEWLPRLNLAEKIQPGEIVGLHGGRITKRTRGAIQVMAVSTGAIVAGNDPGEKAREGYELVAFIGQVTVRVRGTVKFGDFVVASRLDDGTGIAVSPERITTEQFEQVVGQAWEASADPGVKSVRIAVGLNRRDPTVSRLVEYSRKQTARISALEARLTAFEARLDSKTTARNLKANHRRKSSDRRRRNQFSKDRSQLE